MKTPEQHTAAARKAWITRKANATKRAAAAIEGAIEAAKPKTCTLCGCDKQIRYEHITRRGSVPVEHPIDGRYCDTCKAGLESGEFAAIGVAHEIRQCRNGRAWSCHEDMKPLLKMHRLETATGSIALLPWLPKIGDGMSLTELLKAHKKANSKQVFKVEIEAEQSA